MPGCEGRAGGSFREGPVASWFYPSHFPGDLPSGGESQSIPRVCPATSSSSVFALSRQATAPNSQASPQGVLCQPGHFRCLQRPRTAAARSWWHLHNCASKWGKDRAILGVMALDAHLPGHLVGAGHGLRLTVPAPSLTLLSSCCQRCESCKVGRPPRLWKGWEG